MSFIDYNDFIFNSPEREESIEVITAAQPHKYIITAV